MSPLVQPGNSSDQQDAIEFLASPAAYEATGGVVKRVETHGAIVFLAGENAYKIKKAVRFSYMDFSTLELRRRACEREIELNQAHAPDLYLGVVAITRRADGELQIGGNGTPIEWAVHMRRFADGSLLSDVVERGDLGAALARDMADAVVRHHRTARISRAGDAASRTAKLIQQVAEGLRSPDSLSDPARTVELEAECSRHLAGITPLLNRREQAGFIRRCHGDLHLANIVMWHARPTLFDAIEFDEEIATIDTLYDLAFLLMDLDARGHRTAANIVLNRYLWRSQQTLDLEGLAALPLFLALRAAIRGMVHSQRAAQSAQSLDNAMSTMSARYIAAALGYLRPTTPRLVAVGGLSGTGKSTLAAALAPLIGPAPGAVHLRSDLERKAMFGAEETDRLPAECYSPDAGRQVYALLMDKARAATAARHSVIVDAVFLAKEERRGFEEIAKSLSVPFQGVWLTAPPETVLARVNSRSGDASDATADVVRRQMAWKCSGLEWPSIDASKSPEATQSAVRRLLEIV